MTTQEFNDTIQKLKKSGWVPFLWHVDDVKNNYDVSDDEAIEVLTEAFDKDYVMEAIFSYVDDICEQYEYERIDE